MKRLYFIYFIAYVGTETHYTSFQQKQKETRRKKGLYYLLKQTDHIFY